jgi:putative hemolysin
MRKGNYRHLIGCASAPLADGGAQAAAVRDKLQGYMADERYRVYPHLPFQHQGIERAASAELPPLIKGYLRLGGKICGEPALDPEFNTADFLVWVSLDDIPPKYARHFELLAMQGEAATV